VKIVACVKIISICIFSVYFKAENHVTKRLEWAKANLNRDWNNVIFMDESSFWSSLSKAWSTKLNRVLQRTIKHPVKVHIWECFSKRDFGCFFLFMDNLNAEKMRSIHQKCLLKFADKFFSSDVTS